MHQGFRPVVMHHLAFPSVVAASVLAGQGIGPGVVLVSFCERHNRHQRRRTSCCDGFRTNRTGFVNATDTATAVVVVANAAASASAVACGRGHISDVVTLALGLESRVALVGRHGFLSPSCCNEAEAARGGLLR